MLYFPLPAPLKALLYTGILFIALLCKALSIKGQAPGEISTTAKVLEADELFNFQDGVAIIKKGTAYALINKEGALIVPFNKYASIKYGKAGSHLLIVRGNEPANYLKEGLINSAGKEILPCQYHSILPLFDADGYLYVYGRSNEKPFFVNSEGRKVTVTLPPSYQLINTGSKVCADNLCPAAHFLGAGRKSGYTDRSGKVVIPAQFDEADGFSEGLACVGKRDAFGAMKYGFINKQGNLVIPLQFTNKPSAFSCGRALVTPVRNAEFKYALINKEGQIVHTLKNSPGDKELFIANSFNTKYVNGYSEWYATEKSGKVIYLMDSLGKLISQRDYFASVGAPENMLNSHLNLGSAIGPIIRVTGKGYANHTGFVNMRTGKTLPPIFHVSNSDHFDPVSKLVLSSRFDTKQGKKVLEGYINEEGVYVIIKGEGNKW
jgi:hypothetical protein